MLKKIDADLIGSLASVVCLIHCLFMPWVIMFSGAWLSQYFTHPLFHHLMLVVALLIGIPVFLRSYIKYNSKLVLFCGLIGLSLTSYGTFREEPCCPPPANEVANVIEEDSSSCETSCEDQSCAETALLNSVDTSETSDTAFVNKSEIKFSAVPIGVAFILLAHILNFKHRKKCQRHCCPG